MNRALLIQLLLAGLVMAVATAALLLPRMQRDARIAERLRVLPSGGRAPARPRAALPGLMRNLGGLLLGSGLLGAETQRKLRQTVTAAGLRGPSALAAFVGAKVGLLFGLPLLVLMLVPGGDGPQRPLALLCAAVVGLLGPDYALRSMRTRHRKAVEKALPDALDLLVICAEAGLPLEAAVERVSAEMAESSTAVSAEFATTATELRILPDRRTALTNMGERTGLEPLRRLGGTLAQTLQYGTPLTQALRVLSTELRGETLTRFEARAARLPALLTVPTILFILPCIFLVVGGPAVLRVLDLMTGP